VCGDCGGITEAGIGPKVLEDRSMIYFDFVDARCDLRLSEDSNSLRSSVHT
jgi:hypothetical protein